MFLYSSLLAGFAFVAVPLLVHLINMLRHRRRPWAAMDFLLLSFRKRQKWLRLRQFLLLVSRILLATLVVALLCGWTGGRQLLQTFGGETTHHIVILDDSYSMGDVSGDGQAYSRALEVLEQLVQRLASDSGEHQLTVMRASRAALSVRGGSESGDAAADLSAQTLTGDSGLIARVMATSVSSIRTDLVPAFELAGELAQATTASKIDVYIASDFRQRDWGSTERLSEAMGGFADDKIDVTMVDCAVAPLPNLAVTEITPRQDVWVAGVPVVIHATVKNYGPTDAQNVTMACQVVRYGDEIAAVDPTRRLSGTIESQPGIVIEDLAAGEEITKTFQVFINQAGTHAVEVQLPGDALDIDNARACALPLSEVQRVLIVDSDPDEVAAYAIASALNPGSQVQLGAIPDVKPPGFLRSATAEALARYRAIYLIDIPEIADSTAGALHDYVAGGGGLAWFLGKSVNAKAYNERLLVEDRRLLSAPLEKIVELPVGGSRETGDVVFGDAGTLVDPLRGAGNSILSLVGITKSWSMANVEVDREERDRAVFRRRDKQPLVTEHRIGTGTVVTSLTSLDSEWTNWPGDATFVPFILLSNARLWSGATAATSRQVTEPLTRSISTDDYFPEVKLLPPTSPPRVAMDVVAVNAENGSSLAKLQLDPLEQLISGSDEVDEFLRPGITELGMLKADGGGVVVPSVAVIQPGEGDLRRADSADIRTSLLPLEIEFVSSRDWTRQIQSTGSSSLGLILLALLALVLAAEQALAYFASYHTSTRVGDPESTAGNSAFGLSAAGGKRL